MRHKVNNNIKNQVLQRYYSGTEKSFEKKMLACEITTLKQQ
jgi:hypothetical protein